MDAHNLSTDVSTVLHLYLGSSTQTTMYPMYVSYPNRDWLDPFGSRVADPHHCNCGSGSFFTLKCVSRSGSDLIKVMQIWPRSSRAQFWASTPPLWAFISLLRSIKAPPTILTFTRIWIQLPEKLRIHADLDLIRNPARPGSSTNEMLKN